MKVLKFGGTSVANANTIKQVAQIVAKSKYDKAVVVVSALGGITDLLLNAMEMAADNDKVYREKLEEIEFRHITTIKELFPIQEQSGILSRAS